MADTRDQRIGRAFFDVQLRVGNVVVGLETLAGLTVTRLDGFLQLERRIGGRQHG